MLARAMRKGAEGSICGLANIAPRLLRPLIHGGKDSPQVKELVDMITSFPVLPAVKALVAHIRADKDFIRVRPPLNELAPVLRKNASAAFDAILAG